LTPCSLVDEFNISAERITFFPEDGGDTFHRNMGGTYLPTRPNVGIKTTDTNFDAEENSNRY